MTFGMIIALQPLYYIILVIIITKQFGADSHFTFFYLPGSRACSRAGGGGSGGELSPGWCSTVIHKTT